MAGKTFKESFNWTNAVEQYENSNDSIGYISTITFSKAVELKKLSLSCPFNGSPPSGFPVTITSGDAGGTIECDAIIERFDWDSGQNSPITIRAYFHKENQANLATIDSPDIQVAFWMIKKENAAVDDATKNTWFEWFFPKESKGSSAVAHTMMGKLRDKPGGGVEQKFDWNVDRNETTLGDTGTQYIGVTFTLMPTGVNPVIFEYRPNNLTSSPSMHDWGNRNKAS